MTSQRIRRALFGSAAISLCLSGAALAQQTEEPALVDEITITAQKREQSVYDVGGTLAVAGAETLQTRRVELV